MHQKGDLKRADILYQDVLNVEPENAAALHYGGLLAQQRGDTATAIDMLTRALAADPERPEYYNNFAVILGKSGELDDALELFDEAIRIKSDYAEAHSNRACVLEQMKRVDEAVAGWRRAIELKPDYAEAHARLGRFLLKVAQGNDWVSRHRKPRPNPTGGESSSSDATSLRVQPKCIDNKKVLDEAIGHLQNAARLAPRQAGVRFHLGNALREKGIIAEAMDQFREAICIRPHFVEAHGNLGAAYNDLAEHREAIRHLERAISLRAGFADAHWNLSLALLALGEWERGWVEYEWRRQLPADRAKQNRFLHPAWNGCSVRGRRVLVVAEQGLGDTVLFVRYCAMLANEGAHVIAECQKPLVELVRGCEGVAEVIAQRDPLPSFDLYVRLASLPGIFRTTIQNVPARVPYLYPDPSRVEQWRARLGDARGLKVGIAWQGNPGFAHDRTRSIPLVNFAPLPAVDGIRLICLQKNAGREQLEANAGVLSIETLAPEPDADGGVADTPAIMANLDLIITSDSFVAHLAGALGVRTWVALSHNCDWRWLREREDCVWYPTLRLFRQAVPGDWQGVFRYIAAELAIFARKTHRTTNDMF